MSVYDVAVSAYLPPFTCRAKGEGIRMFSDVLLNRENPVGRHPRDYVLYQIGVFDDASGMLESLMNPEKVISGTELIAVDEINPLDR